MIPKGYPVEAAHSFIHDIQCCYLKDALSLTTGSPQTTLLLQTLQLNMPKNSERSSGSVPFFSCSFSLLAALHDSQKKASLSTPKLYIPSTIKSEINLVL